MPSQDLKYFADIYIKLEQGNNNAEVEQNVNGWSEKFLDNSPPYQAYVKEVLGAESPSQSVASQQQSSGSSVPRRIFSLLRQGWVLSKRYLQLIWRDRLSLALALLTAPVGIILIALVVKDETPLAAYDAPLALRVLFIFTCAAIFVGLLSSVQEIVKESSIYARERLINLSTLSYLGSKLLIRSGLAFLQTFLIVLVILLGFKSPESELIPWPLGLSITTFLTIITTICLGLMVSAWVNNETEANNSLSLILLPQIILSGVLFEPEGFLAQVSWLTISRWSVGAYGTLVNVKDMVPLQLEPPFDPEVYAANWQNLTRNWMLLVLHGLVYLGVAAWLQKKRYRF
jgi:ABC-type multidrug transport system permease subunit